MRAIFTSSGAPEGTCSRSSGTTGSACRFTPSGWSVAGSSGHLRPMEWSRSPRRSWLTCLTGSIGATRFSPGGRKSPAEACRWLLGGCGLLTHPIVERGGTLGDVAEPARVDPDATPDRSRRGARADPSATRRTGRGRGPRIGCRGADRAYEAGDRQAPARTVRPVFRARPQGARSVGVAARGTGSRDQRERSHTRGQGGRRRREELRPPAAGARPLTGPSAARAGRYSGSLRVSGLRRQAGQARRGYYRDTGNRPAPMEGDPDGAGEGHLPLL